jgi:hypothetical protein
VKAQGKSSKRKLDFRGKAVAEIEPKQGDIDYQTTSLSLIINPLIHGAG